MVEYSYNSRGEQNGCAGTLSTALGILNPFRYRGYIYDEETGLYYLQTRYYDPSLCRFISADVFLSIGQGVLGCNAFAYCGNEPADISDGNGMRSIYHLEYILAEGCDAKNTDDISQYNCTCYAYGIDSRSSYSYRYLSPGDIGERYDYCSSKQVVNTMRNPFKSKEEKRDALFNAIYADMEVLGYYCAFAYKDSEDNCIISEGNWIIAYTYDATSELESDFDFHFLKYDGNKWSEKRGGNSVNIIGTAFPTIDQLKPYNSDVFCFEIGPAIPAYMQH